MTGSEAIDAYLDGQPEAQRQALGRLRSLILSLVPDAEQTISYAIPAFKLNGKGVVWIAGWKAHCSIYPLSDAFLEAHRSELDGYGLGKGTLRFPPDAPPPDALLTALVRDRLSEIAAESAG